MFSLVNNIPNEYASYRHMIYVFYQNRKIRFRNQGRQKLSHLIAVYLNT